MLKRVLKFVPPTEKKGRFTKDKVLDLSKHILMGTEGL
jgi:hypothetical protein